eukprot:2074471-Amphidinium_carterae.1
MAGRTGLHHSPSIALDCNHVEAQGSSPTPPAMPTSSTTRRAPQLLMVVFVLKDSASMNPGQHVAQQLTSDHH